MVFNLLIMLAASEPGVEIFAYIAGLVWLIFSTLGVFNAADIYNEEKIRTGQTFGYGTAAKAGVVILILSAIGRAL